MGSFLVSVIVIMSFTMIFYILYRRSKETARTDGDDPSVPSAIREIYSCNTAIEANLIASKLNDAGIETFLADENMASANPMLTGALGGVKVKVRTTDYEQAKIVLGDYMEPEITCPNCGSDNTIKYFKSGDGANGSAESFVELTLRVDKDQEYETAYHCNDCEHDFE